MQAMGFFEEEKERKRSIITLTHTPHKKVSFCNVWRLPKGEISDNSKMPKALRSRFLGSNPIPSSG